MNDNQLYNKQYRKNLKAIFYVRKKLSKFSVPHSVGNGIMYDFNWLNPRDGLYTAIEIWSVGGHYSDHVKISIYDVAAGLRKLRAQKQIMDWFKTEWTIRYVLKGNDKL